MNDKFQNALHRRVQLTPPVWMMRQAGRYHKHYQALRLKHSFMELCKIPELAAEVARGPVAEFDFDVAILFSDLLFPLEAMGMGLTYGDGGPKLGWHLSDLASVKKLLHADQAIAALQFQKSAMQATREVLPPNKSLIGFVGGPWTLFSYAAQGRHEGGLVETKAKIELFKSFSEKLIPLLLQNIQLQFEGGAEVVMLFDTAAGELDAQHFTAFVVPELLKLCAKFPGRLGYYSKGTLPDHYDKVLSDGLWAGFGFDHRWNFAKKIATHKKGFIQGNFDQSFLFSENFEQIFRGYLRPIQELNPNDRAGWVCGLGHGVLPKTPERNVKRFVEILREELS